MNKCTIYTTLLIIYIFFYSKGLQAQELSSNNILEIVDLYADSQFDIVKAKLNNYGYSLMKSTPDYTLHGVGHFGDFTMIREKSSTSPTLKRIGWPDTDIWYFSIVDHTQDEVTAYRGMGRQVSIKFESTILNAPIIYDQLSIFLANAGFGTRDCRGHSKCADFGYVDPIIYVDKSDAKHPRKMARRESYSLGLDDEPITHEGQSIPRATIYADINIITWPILP